jgi:hypothetical protein
VSLSAVRQRGANTPRDRSARGSKLCLHRRGTVERGTPHMPRPRWADRRPCWCATRRKTTPPSAASAKSTSSVSWKSRTIAGISSISPEPGSSARSSANCPPSQSSRKHTMRPRTSGIAASTIRVRSITEVLGLNYVARVVIGVAIYTPRARWRPVVEERRFRAPPVNRDFVGHRSAGRGRRPIVRGCHGAPVTAEVEQPNAAEMRLTARVFLCVCEHSRGTVSRMSATSGRSSSPAASAGTSKSMTRWLGAEPRTIGDERSDY